MTALLDKEVVKFTRDGLRQDNLATGRSRMLTQSDQAREMKYPAAKLGVPQKKPFAQPVIGTVRPKRITVQPLSPMRRSKLQRVSAWLRRPIIAQFDDDNDNDNAGWSAMVHTANTARSLSRVIVKRDARPFSAVHTGSAANSYTAAKPPEKQAAADTSRKKYRVANSRRQADVKQKAQAAKRAATVRRAKAAQQGGGAAWQTTAVKGAASGAAKAAGTGVVKGLGIAALIAAAVIILLLIISAVLSMLFGSVTQTTAEIEAYVQELDASFLSSVMQTQDEYSRKGAQVTVTGTEYVHTDPASLALLATGEWTMANLTTELRESLSQCHRLINTLQVTEHEPEETEDGGSSASSGEPKPPLQVSIAVIVDTPESVLEKLDYTQHEKESLRDILFIMRQVTAGASGGYLWPVPGHTYISSGFGYRADPISGEGDYHSGIDIPAPEGTPVVAAVDGSVRLAGMNGTYGNCVMVQNDDGTVAIYGHNSRVLVQAGDKVTQGQQIALVGHTGRVTGDHSHFEIRKDGTPVDPNLFLNNTGG